MGMLRLKADNIVAVDVGSQNIKVLIAEIDDSYQPVIKSYAVEPSKGIKNGIVVDIEEATRSISNAVSEAEKKAETLVHSCYVNLTGEHIQSLNTRGLAAIARDTRGGLGEPREIEQEDIERVIEHTKAIPMSNDRQILHILPQEFIIDENSGVRNPIGLLGRRLEAKVHLVTCGTTALANLTKCFHNAQLQIEGIVLSSLAASLSCLDDSEKEMGSILIDIGADILDIIVYSIDGIRHTGITKNGFNKVTSDIAYTLRIPLQKAEEIKKKYGTARISLADPNAFFKIGGLGGRPDREILCTNLAEWIEPRVEDIMLEAFEEAKKADIPLTNILSVVLTGGGALLKGTEQVVEGIFNTPTRIGIPQGFVGFESELSDPSFAVSIGLLKYAINERKRNNRLKRSHKGLFNKIKHFFTETI